MNLAKLGLILDGKKQIAKPRRTLLDYMANQTSTAAAFGVEVTDQIQQILSTLPTPSLASGSVFAQAAATRGARPRSRPRSKSPSRPTPLQETPHSYRERVKKELFLLDIDEDISQMDLKTLRKHFGYNNGNIKLGEFCRNVVWQVWRYTQAGSPPQFVQNGCNVRSYRYHVKTITEAHTRSFGRTTDFHKLFGEALSALTGAGLLSYRDLNFIDTNRINRWVAPSFGVKNVVVIAEKRTFSDELLRLGQKHGITVQCTGGVPSRVTVETMLLEMAEAGHDLTEPFVVFAVVDYDPAGWNIACSFVEQMLELGLAKIKSFWPYGRSRPRQPWIDIFPLKDLDREFLDSQRHSLRVGSRAEALADEWVRATGGLYGRGGKDWALSSEAFLGLIEEHLLKKLPEFLPADYRYPKVAALQALDQPLKSYITAKLFSQM